MSAHSATNRTLFAFVYSACAVVSIAGCQVNGRQTLGAVVVACERGEAAEVAGLLPGDVIVGWRHGKAGGAVDSPFRLAIVEQELAPYGPVVLEVRRNGDSLTILIPSGRWRVRYRPRLDEPHLAEFNTAKDAEESGEFDTAAERWRTLAEVLTESGHRIDAAFFQIRRGVSLARTDRGEDSTAALRLGAECITEERLRAAYWEGAGSDLLKAGRAREAGDAFRAAIDILEEPTPTSTGMAFVQLQLCRTNFRRCSDEIKRALETYGSTAKKSLEYAGAWNIRGTVAYFQRDLDTAEEAYREALNIVRARASGSPFEGDLLGNLGLVAKNRGDYSSAKALYQCQMTIAEQLGPGTIQYSHAANYLGSLAKMIGLYEVARLHYERALSSFRIMNSDGPEVAGVLTNLGVVASREMDFEAARRYHEEALEIRRRLDPTSGDVAASLHNLGMVLRRMGDFDLGRRYIEEALELKLEIGPGTGWLANTLFELGELAHEEGRLDEAEDHHMQALEIRRQVLSPDHQQIAECLFALGNIEQARGRIAEAERLWRESITLIEGRSSQLQLSNKAQSRFGAIYDSQHGSLARLLVETGRVGEAWDTLEKARAAELRSLVAHRAAAPPGIPPELWFAKARTESRMARLERRLAGIDPIEEAEALQRYREQLASVEEEFEAIDGQIRGAAPHYAELGSPPMLTLAELRRSLDPGTVVLAYTIGYKRSMVMITGPEGDGGAETRAIIIPVSREELRGRVDRFNSLVARGRTVGTIEPAVLAQGRRLYDLLIEPAGAAVSEARRLLIIPDGPLHELSFAALALPGEDARFLGHVTALLINPSASLAVELGSGSDRRVTDVGAIVAFGDPEYPPDNPTVKEQGLAPLPGSRTEIEAIRQLFGDRATVFVDDAASEANFKAHAATSNVLHCAVHSRIDPSVSMDSALYFSPPSRPDDSIEDGALTAWEIVDTLHLNADLVVLSACSTARGRVIPGEGIVGLARAFQVAGARSVLVSQWAVDDRSTSELMTAFYEQLADGRSTGEALHRAQQIVGSEPEFAHPYHWASFQLRGDWQ